jgi:hypothetical protein
MEYAPLGEDDGGECRITLAFGGSRGGADVVITGRHLSRLFYEIGNHRVHWLWEVPKGRAASAEGAPVVQTIDIREATPTPAA